MQYICVYGGAILNMTSDMYRPVLYMLASSVRINVGGEGFLHQLKVSETSYLPTNPALLVYRPVRHMTGRKRGKGKGGEDMCERKKERRRKIERGEVDESQNKKNIQKNREIRHFSVDRRP